MRAPLLALASVALAVTGAVAAAQSVTIQGSINDAIGATAPYSVVVQQQSSGAQFPNLLNGYVARPPAGQVAGVDYYVGVPQGITLNAPSTLTSNPNITVGGNQVRASGSGYTITNIDFSLDGGYQLILYGSNITVTNSNFAIGSSGQAMLNGDVGGSNNTITHSTFNANGLIDNFNSADIGNISGGTTTIEYCFIENASSDLLDIGGSGSTLQHIIVKNNLFYNSGQVSNSHPDWVQLGGGTYNVDIEYNTFYQTAATVGPGTQGIFVDSGNNGAHVVGANVVSNNTIVTLAGARVNFLIAALAVSGAGNTFSIANNYMDPTGNNNAVYKYVSSQNTQTGNVNMVTGGALNQ